MSDSALSKIQQTGGEISVEIAEENMRRLHAEVQAALEAAEIPIATIGELGGPNHGSASVQLRHVAQLGHGLFQDRQCND